MYQDNDYRRKIKEPITSTRKNAFFTDYTRLMNSKSIRRLANVTQLFPNQEFKTFRNRLTHSVEVSTIARSITEKINLDCIKSPKHYINNDLINFASFAHDLGHPPFGHSGELILNQLMLESGGFESNAQTLRILDKLEVSNLFKNDNRKAIKGWDLLGLNLTARTLASILKYDRVIPKTMRDREFGERNKLVKGYYNSELDLVKKIKSNILEPFKLTEPIYFKTIECQIMDLADDIAFCISDLDDSLNSGFIDIFEILFPTKNIVHKMVEEFNETNQKKIKINDIYETIFSFFEQMFDMKKIDKKLKYNWENSKIDTEKKFILYTYIQYVYRTTMIFSSDEQIRISLLNAIKDYFMNGILFKFNETCPPLSKLFLNEKEALTLFILKKTILHNILITQKFKYLQHQIDNMITYVFGALVSNHNLLPIEFKKKFYTSDFNKDKRRVLCDFIAWLDNNEIIELFKYLTSSKKITMSNLNI